MTSFDGVTFPKVTVRLGIGGGSSDPEPSTMLLDTGQLDTATLGGIGWVEIPEADVLSVSLGRGRTGPLEGAAPGACTILLDGTSGDYDPTNLTGPHVSGGVSLIDVDVPVWVEASYDGTSYDLFYGYLDDLPMQLGRDPTITLICTDGLESLGRAGVGAIAANFDGDLPGARITRILDAVAWPTSLRDLDVGNSQMAATTYGDQALPLLQAVVDSELGLLFADGSGAIVFFDRWHSQTDPRSTTVQADLTDLDAAGDIEMVALEVSLSRDTVFTQARGTRDDEAAVEQVADDLAAQALRGIRTFTGNLGVLLRTDNELLALLEWIVSRYKAPQVRITQVQVEALTLNRWETLLSLRLLDRIAVSRDYGPNTVAAELLIQQMQMTISSQPPAWDITFTTSNPTGDAGDPIILDTGPGLNTGQLAY